MTQLLNSNTLRTTIQLDEKTRDILRDLGRKSETYDEIILKLVEKVELVKEKEKR